MLELTSFEDARAGLRHRDLRQALYDEGEHLMGPVIVNLHGPAHTARRRLENRLFTPETVRWFEQDRIPAIISQEIRDARAAGSPDALEIARRAMLRLSVAVAGIDIDPSPTTFDRLFSLMHRLARSSVVVHATGDKAELVADGEAALAEFDTVFFQPSKQRRERHLRAGGTPERDVLTTLLVNEDELDLDESEVLREAAYFPWVGAHSTAAQLVHLLHHTLAWLTERPHDRARLIDDATWRSRFVHESLRLHPASPVAVRRATCDTTVAGHAVSAGSMVTISIEGANRDRAQFGDDPEHFLPDRHVAGGIPRWGLSFGSGMHACIGRELAAGVAVDADSHHAEPALQGALSLMVRDLIRLGAATDPDDPPVRDESTTRANWGRFPLVFGK